MDYKWNILSDKKAEDIKEILNNILKWKNISKEHIKEFIDFKIEMHSPYLLTNMDKAVDRMNKALENKENVTIIGD